jgi:hypothetical protein
MELDSSSLLSSSTDSLQYKAVIFSSVCPFIFVAVAIIFCSFLTTGHSKGRVILLYPVIFFQCAILNQLFGQYQFFKLLQYALVSFLAEMGIDFVGRAANF